MSFVLIYKIKIIYLYFRSVYTIAKYKIIVYKFCQLLFYKSFVRFRVKMSYKNLEYKFSKNEIVILDGGNGGELVLIPFYSKLILVV